MQRLCYPQSSSHTPPPLPLLRMCKVGQEHQAHQPHLHWKHGVRVWQKARKIRESGALRQPGNGRGGAADPETVGQAQASCGRGRVALPPPLLLQPMEGPGAAYTGARSTLRCCLHTARTAAGQPRCAKGSRAGRDKYPARHHTLDVEGVGSAGTEPRKGKRRK